MKNLVLVSKCRKLISEEENSYIFEFSFKGFYKGKKLNKVLVRCNRHGILQKEQEYILYLSLVGQYNDFIFTNLVKSKVIE